jgi:hypothetical protein
MWGFRGVRLRLFHAKRLQQVSLASGDIVRSGLLRASPTLEVVQQMTIQDGVFLRGATKEIAAEGVTNRSVVLLDGPEGHLKALGRAVLVVEKGARQLATGTRD